MKAENKMSQRNVIGRSINYLHPSDKSVFEISALKVRESKCPVWNNEWIKPGGNATGYFSAREKAIEAALGLEQQSGAENITITLNPVNPALLARADNRMKPSKHRTSNEDIVHLNNFLIDVDPVRPSGVSSTDEEHTLALATAEHIASVLYSDGWPGLMIADSGNGAHLIGKIDLPNNAESCLLLENCLKALSYEYSTDAISIDTQVGNPGRLVKIYGTTARKGDATTDQPHRQSKIISCPEKPEIINKELLEELAAIAPEKQSKKDEADSSLQQTANSDQNFNVQAYLDHYNRDVFKIIRKDNATFYRINCLFDLSHQPMKGAIVQCDNGKLLYNCFHKGCGEKTWEEARKLISGDDSLSPFMKNQPQKKTGKNLPQEKPVPLTAAQLGKKKYKPIQYIVKKIFPFGATMISGAPKIGKSWLAMNTACAVSTGKLAFGKIPVERRGVLYLALEDTEKRLQQRLFSIFGNEPLPDNFYLVTKWPKINAGGIEYLEEWLIEHPDCKFVIIDTFGKIRATKANSSILYLDDMIAISEIKDIADQFDAAILIVHHNRKAEAEDFVHSLSGTTGISGTVDTVMVLQKARLQGNAVLKITGRDIEELQLNLTFNKENCTWEMNGEADKPIYSANEQKIIDFINSEGKKMRTKDIESALAEKGMNASTCRSLLSRMTAKGILIRVEDGVYITDTLYTLNQHNNTTTTTLRTTNSTLATVATNTTAATGNTRLSVELVEPLYELKETDLFSSKYDFFEEDVDISKTLIYSKTEN